MRRPNPALQALGIDCQYTRDDINYDTWYGTWPKTLAKTRALPDLIHELNGSSKAATAAAQAHHRAIQRTHSMHSQSQARAQSGTVTAAIGEQRAALQAAIEIHHLFPEHAKKEQS